MFVVGTDLFVISPLLPLIAGDFGLSAATAGLSVTAFSLTYLLSAPFIGYVADRFGRRRTLLTCLFAFALTNLLTGAAPGFGWLLAVRAAAGIATAGVSPLIYAGVGEAAPPARRATWMAIAVSGLLLSLSAGAPVGTLVAASLGWRAPVHHPRGTQRAADGREPSRLAREAGGTGTGRRGPAARQCRGDGGTAAADRVVGDRALQRLHLSRGLVDRRGTVAV